MDDVLKQARKRLDELDLHALQDIDLGKLKDVDLEQMLGVNFSDLKKVDRKKLRKRLEQLDFQKRQDEAATEGFLGGLLLGIVVGAILALIFAPKSGSETRQAVAETASGLRHKAEDLVGQGDDSNDDPSASSLGDEPAIEREIGNGESRPNSSVT